MVIRGEGIPDAQMRGVFLGVSVQLTVGRTMTMKSILNRQMVAGVILLAGLSAGHCQLVTNRTLTHANNAFAIDFYKKAGTEPGNPVFSPYSISAAFAMTYPGAAGETARQMQKVMYWTNAAPKVASDFAELDQLLLAAQKEGAVQISIANALWPQKGYRFRQQYLDLLTQTFKTSLHEADFEKQPEVERLRVNEWVEKQTRDRIKGLMPVGSINNQTRLVLANAIYFKAKWGSPFKTAATHPGPFYLASGDSVNTPLMAIIDDFRFAVMPTFKLLEMPYQRGKLSMLVILPNATNGLSQLNKELSAEKLDQWIKALRTTRVSVFFPKFTVSFQLKLNDALSALGMPDAFDRNRADFAGMTAEQPPLFMSSAMHKAFVEVTEEGTEAAAATGLVMTPTSAGPRVEIPIFRADHPFLYLIRHNPSGTILFFGRLNVPAKA
jgi:serpin B